MYMYIHPGGKFYKLLSNTGPKRKLILEKELFYKLHCVIWIGNSMSNGSRVIEYFIVISTLTHIFVKIDKALERMKTNLVSFITEKVNLVEMFISDNSQCIRLVPTIGKDVN